MKLILSTLLLLFLAAGEWGFSRFGYRSYAPAALVFLLMLILLLTGKLDFDL
jgi:hypothetical protein